MTQTFHALPGRGVISLTGDGARAWLDNLVSNDLGALDHKPAVFAALLSPQGKLLFEFFVVKSHGGLLLETARDSVPALIKRLALYRLRARVEIAGLPAERCAVWARQGEAAKFQPAADGALIYDDPRAPGHLRRGIADASVAQALQGPGDYDAERVRLCLPEAPQDYALGDTFPHEANFDLLDGVSFSKGCYVGQEVVSRMQNKAVVRKRIVRVIGRAPLVRGTEIMAGAAAIGKIGTVSGEMGLAMLRLDRAAEAQDGGQGLIAGDTGIEIDARALNDYRRAAANRPVVDL